MDHAGAGELAGSHSDSATLYALEYGGRYSRQLCANGTSQGHERAAGDADSRLQERIDTGGHRRRPDDRRVDHGLVLYRKYFSDSRHWPVLRDGDPAARLPDDHGDDHGLDGGDQPNLPDHRPPICVAGSQGHLYQGAVTWT